MGGTYQSPALRSLTHLAWPAPGGPPFHRVWGQDPSSPHLILPYPTLGRLFPRIVSSKAGM